jgi:uncharacterized protein (DUF58 family)
MLMAGPLEKKPWKTFFPGSWEELVQRLDHWQQNLPLTYEGKIWLVFSLAMFFTGLWRGINLITMLACFLLMAIFFNWRLSRQQLKEIRGKRIRDEGFFAEQSKPFSLEIFHAGSQPANGIWVHQQGQAWFLARIEPKQVVHVQGWMGFPSRGKQKLSALQTRSGFPLGLAECQRNMEEEEEIIVLPRLGSLRRGALRRLLQQHSPTVGLARTVPRRNPSAQTDFHGLRNFQPGDTPRWIHWRTTARCGELMVREFEESPSDNLILLVDPYKPQGQAGEDPHLELTIRLAATICWEWCRQKGERLILGVGGSRPRVIEGLTSTELALEMLQTLALEMGNHQTEVEGLLDGLNVARLPVAPVLLLSPHRCEFGEEIQQAFHRPIAAVNVAQGEFEDFYDDRGEKEDKIK